MMTHEEAQELIAVLALNAVDGIERAELEEHIEECIRCSRELDGLRGVSSTLGNVSEPASEELWQRISEHLYDDIDPGNLPPIRVLDFPNAVVTPLARRRTNMSNGTKFTAGLFSVAAAALVAVLSFNLVQANNHVAQLTNALGVANRGAVVAALVTPGHIDVTLDSAHHAPVAKIVLLNGHGYVVSSKMPQLSSAQTYQLWGIIAGKPISIGLMGSKPTNIEFSVASALQPSKLAVTIEPAGGSQTPSSPPVASGTVTA
jgi:anti-sigma-K factor RskA